MGRGKGERRRKEESRRVGREGEVAEALFRSKYSHIGGKTLRLTRQRRARFLKNFESNKGDQLGDRSSRVGDNFSRTKMRRGRPWRRAENTLLLSTVSNLIEITRIRGDTVTRTGEFYDDIAKEYNAKIGRNKLQPRNGKNCKDHLSSLLKKAEVGIYGSLNEMQINTLQIIQNSTQKVAASSSSRGASTGNNGGNEVENSGPLSVNFDARCRTAIPLIEQLFMNGYISDAVRRKSYQMVYLDDRWLRGFLASTNKANFANSTLE